MSAKDRVRAKTEEARKNADACANRVVARGHMCGGCHMDYYCDVSAKFKAAKRERR